jgi:hypothetical protein
MVLGREGEKKRGEGQEGEARIEVEKGVTIG